MHIRGYFLTLTLGDLMSIMVEEWATLGAVLGFAPKPIISESVLSGGDLAGRRLGLIPN